MLEKIIEHYRYEFTGETTYFILFPVLKVINFIFYCNQTLIGDIKYSIKSHSFRTIITIIVKKKYDYDSKEN